MQAREHRVSFSAMPNLILRPDWHLPESRVTPERAYRNRRKFLRELGLTGGGLLAAAGLLESDVHAADARQLYPAKRNIAFSPDLPLSKEKVFTTYNNFYEFGTDKEAVHQRVDKFVTAPWPVKIHGLCEKPVTLDAQELAAEFGLEERVYRFRCVEAWSAIVPWTGFELRKLLEKVQPKAGAKFVKFVTAFRPEQMPGVARLRGYPWPYTEGLTLGEAMHPLTMLATGVYGKPLPKQNGAPIRLVVPWKYGFKSGKSLVEIELTDKQPKTLWETLSPEEYPFEANVDPAIPHARWSQATERVVDSGDRIRTLPLNGYAAQLSGLYKK
jgi:sulfoxide reductase catalytic subunit YedY